MEEETSSIFVLEVSSGVVRERTVVNNRTKKKMEVAIVEGLGRRKNSATVTLMRTELWIYILQTSNRNILW